MSILPQFSLFPESGNQLGTAADVPQLAAAKRTELGDVFGSEAGQSVYRDVQLKTLGADNGYHQKGFVQGCRERGIAPHVACKDKVQVAGLDGRTTTQRNYQVSLKIRKRVEEIFGWIKTVGGFRRSRYRGRERYAGLGLLRGGDLQPAANGTDRGGLKRRRRPGKMPGASGPRSVPRVQRLESGRSWDSGWLMHQRRLVRDYETTEASAAAWIYIAMIRIQLRRLA